MILLEENFVGRSEAADYHAVHGKVMMQALAIRLSGDYKVKLTVNGTEVDSCQFTVTRTNRVGAMEVQSTNSGMNYARGTLTVSIESDRASELFAKYDEKLLYSMLNALTKKVETDNEEMFAQRFPGKVVVQCRLDFKGGMTEPKIMENTISDECGEIFQKALLKAAPYSAWPEEVHQKLGSDQRPLKLTIYFE